MINIILQFLELDLVNINATAKFYQNIPNGLRVKFHCFQNLNLGKTSTNPKCHGLHHININVYAQFHHHIPLSSRERESNFHFFRIWSSAKPRPMKNVISKSLRLDLVNINVYAKVYQNISLNSRDRAIFTFSEFEPRQRLGQSQMTFDNPFRYILLISYQYICKILSKYSKRFKSYQHFSRTGRGQNLHKLSGDKIKCLIIGHSMRFNFKFQLTFLGLCISGPFLSSICSIRVAVFCTIPCSELICEAGRFSNVWDFDALGNAYDTHTTDNLSMNSCISFIVNQDVGIGFHRDLVGNFYEQRFLHVEYSLCHYTDLSSICRISNEDHILSVTTDTGVVFTFWKSIL